MMVLISRVLPYLLVVSVVFAIAASGWRLGVDQTESRWQAKWDSHLLEDERTTARANNEQRAKEQAMRRAIEEVTTNAQHTIDQAAADAADASAAADSLRQRADAIATELAASQAGRNACTAAASQAAAEHARVLADVLKRADERAGHLAAVADQARARGLTCERAYDEVRARQ